LTKTEKRVVVKVYNMEEILIILACVPLYVVNAFCDKFASTINENKQNFLYNSIKFLVGSICLLPIFIFGSGEKLGLGVICCGVAGGIMYAVSKTIMLKGYEKTSVAFMTLCHSSGMILPCIIGHFWWNEQLGILALVGVILAIASIVLLKDARAKKKEFDLIGIIIGVVVFLTSGGIMIAQKLMGRYFQTQSVSAFNLYSFFIAFLILGCFSKPKSVGVKTLKPLTLCATGSALSLVVISLVMTSLTSKVPSVILFPLFNGVGIIAVCIGSVFAFKEKFSVKKAIGLAIGVIGLCLINI
jgi:drug/metabolite transporter (DMT)-like permease